MRSRMCRTAAVLVLWTVLRGAAGEAVEVKNLTVAVIANEFFDPTIGRIGGFGMNTKMVGDFFSQRPELGAKVIYVFASRRETPTTEQKVSKVVHGWPFVSAWTRNTSKGQLSTEWTRSFLESEGVDIAVMIDYRQTYVGAIEALPAGVPVVLWTQDPRTKEQMKRIKQIRDPRMPDRYPPGLRSPDATGCFDAARKNGHEMATAVPWFPLRDRLPEAYGASFEGHDIFELPNIVDTSTLCPPPPWNQRSEKPSVMYLARLDPYKRPWVMLELARRNPNVTFHVAGRPHFDFGDYDRDLPPNVVHYKHADGAVKAELLAKSWFLVSTSIHEGLAISYLEALTCGQPILGMTDPGGLVSKYGIFVGHYPGSGMEGMPALQASFERLIADQKWRHDLAAAGRQHVVETHNAARFGKVFADIVASLGVEVSYESNLRKLLSEHRF